MIFDSSPPAALLGDDPSDSFARRRTFFVDAGAGSDSNTGSFNDPFQTIGRAIFQSASEAGKNRIAVNPGVYNENLSISDFGGLDILGRGVNPHDVIVNGLNNGPAVQISESSSVKLSNMMFVNGKNGIYAEEVEHLSLHKIRSRDNDNYGLVASDLGRLDITHSNFVDNDRTGARIMYVETVDIGHSYFGDNADNGLWLEYNGSAKLRHVVAMSNGFYDEESDGPTAKSYGNGVFAYGNETLEFRGGHFNENDRRGIDMRYNESSKLFSVHALSNEDEGVYGMANETVAVHDGMLRFNGESGLYLNGYSNYENGREDGGPDNSVSVVGTRFWDNDDEGLRLVDYDLVELRGLHVRRNEYDGVDVEDSNRVWLQGINTMHNGDDGIDIDSTAYVTAINNWSAENDGDGLDVDGGARVTKIRSGAYVRNGDDGVDLDGDYRRLLQDVMVENVFAFENDSDGIEIDDANFVKMLGGNFSKNEDGVDLYNVGSFSGNRIRALHNRDNGLYSHVGNGGGPGNGDGNGETRFGEFSLQQSVFNHNEDNGILIAALGLLTPPEDSNGGPRNGHSAIEYDVDFDRVIAKSNGDSGLYLGDPYYDKNANPPVQEKDHYGAYASFDVDIHRGNYSSNGSDGIHAESQPSEFTLNSMIDVVRPVVNDNGGTGLYIDAFDPSIGMWLNLEGGTYNKNGGDGIYLNTFTDQRGEPLKNHDGHEDHGSKPELMASYVIAERNGANGLNYNTTRMSFPQMDESRHNETEYLGVPLVSLVGGSFTHNEFSGVNMNVTTNEMNSGPIGSLIYVDRIAAIGNGQHGLSVFGYSPYDDGYDYESKSHRGIQVDVVKGVFNQNGVDGLHMSDLGTVRFDRTVAIGNKDDGFEGTDVFDVLGEWVFVGNEDEDFVWN